VTSQNVDHVTYQCGKLAKFTRRKKVMRELNNFAKAKNRSDNCMEKRQQSKLPYTCEIFSFALRETGHG
jgi:hypothetical protein